MKLTVFKDRILIKEAEYQKNLDKAWTDGHEEGYEASQDKIDELNRSLRRKNKEIANLKETVGELEDMVEVYEKERDNVRDVIRQQILLDDQKAAVEAKKDSLDKKEASLKNRESKLEDAEQGRYKVGYADGVADGVRKINEITQADRDNAMKVAMVAASSHTPAANMKEVMDASRQLTEGTNAS